MNRFPFETSVRCSRLAKKDGYCLIHHPDERRMRNKKRMETKEILFNAGDRKNEE